MPKKDKDLAKKNSLYFLKPFLKFLPEVAKPIKKVQIQERVFWTVMCLFVYLVCCQIPVYGIEFSRGSDPIYWMRMILASNHGTVMELGITPLVTSSLVMQLLAGIKVIRVGESKEEKSLFEGAQKLVGIILTFGQAFALVWSGMYGPPSQLGLMTAIFIVMQIFFAGIICILLDEMLQKGHGLGSGTSLFIATNICESVLWKAFSPTTVQTYKGSEFEGAVIALFHMILTKDDKVRALKEGFYRSNLPNITNLLATILIFLIVIYFQGWKTEISIKPRGQKGGERKYPIKMFYTSNMPIILQSSLVSNFVMLSQVIYKRFGSNVIINILGRWTTQEYSGQAVPIGGLVYYITSPGSLNAMVADPIHSLTYVLFVLLSCAFFSYIWINVSGAAPKDVARSLTQQRMVIVGAENKPIEKLKKYIPISAAFGGMCIGALTLIADFLGALGSGTGILLSVTMIHQYFEILQKEEVDFSSFMNF